MNRRRLLIRLSVGAVHNIPFSDFTDLVRGFGFELARVSGSHHIFVHPDIIEQVNLQQLGREAKPYQIRQFLRLVEQRNLRLEE